LAILNQRLKELAAFLLGLGVGTEPRQPDLASDVFNATGCLLAIWFSWLGAPSSNPVRLAGISRFLNFRSRISGWPSG